MYYRNVRGLKSAITKILSYDYCRDINGQSTKIYFDRKIDFEQLKTKLHVILQRVFKYSLSNQINMYGYNVTVLNIEQLNEIAPPIPKEFFI